MCELEHRNGVTLATCELEHKSQTETELATEYPHLFTSNEVVGGDTGDSVISDTVVNVPAGARHGQPAGVRTVEVSNSEDTLIGGCSAPRGSSPETQE